MTKKKSASKDLKDERKKHQIEEIYRTRLTYLKKAQIFVREDKMAQAVDSYNKYLGVLSLYFDIPEDRLSPTLFNAETDLTELLLISHAYWDLAKAYDRSPNLQRECLRCLEQFVKFSIGFKYQHVNAQIIRKFNNKKQAHNLKAFENAYQRIQVSSKKCFIATMCFGENHPKTEALRNFRFRLIHYTAGRIFISLYNAISPLIVNILEKNNMIRDLSVFFIRPLITFFIGAGELFIPTLFKRK